MLPDLVLQQRLLHPLQQLVDGVDVGVNRLEPLDLGSDGGRVGQVLLIVHPCKSFLGNRIKTLEPFSADVEEKMRLVKGKVEAVTSKRRKKARRSLKSCFPPLSLGELNASPDVFNLQIYK